MATTNEVKLGINLRKNENMKSQGYGKYYPEVDRQATLSLKGFAKHMADHGSIYTKDVIEGVLQKICVCLPELLSQGVPVQLEPLGTFYPSAQTLAPVLNIASMEALDPYDVVKGIKINFLAYGVEDENITSRRFMQDHCSLELRNIVKRRLLSTDATTGKKTYVQDKTPIATAVAEYKKEQESSGD